MDPEKCSNHHIWTCPKCQSEFPEGHRMKNKSVKIQETTKELLERIKTGVYSCVDYSPDNTRDNLDSFFKRIEEDIK